MPTHPTKPPKPRTQQLPSFWRQAYGWRWGTLHPAPKKERRWFITANTAFKALKTREGVDQEWIKRLIEWYFSWWTFNPTHSQGTQARSLHPGVLNATNDDGAAFVTDAFRAWVIQYAPMLGTRTISSVAQQYRGHTHTSTLVAPWRLEDVD